MGRRSIITVAVFYSGNMLYESIWSNFYISEVFSLFLHVVLHIYGFPGSTAGKESACSAGDLGSILGLGRSPGEGNSCPLQCSGLENSMD